MSFNFKKYVRELMVESVLTEAAQTGQASRVDASGVSSVDTSNYKEDPAGSGTFVSTTGKDPYSYSVVSSSPQKIVIKVEGAPSGRESAIGKTFKMTLSNLDNPNVQLLYASLLHLKKISRLAGDETNLQHASTTAEVVIVDRDFDFENYFKEQHDRIKQLGHENADSTLTYERAGLGVVKPNSSSLGAGIDDMIKKIEQKAGVQVVSLLVRPGLVRYMAKKDSLKYVHDAFEIDRKSDFTVRISEHLEKHPPGSEKEVPTGKGETINVIIDEEVKKEEKPRDTGKHREKLEKLPPGPKPEPPHQTTKQPPFREKIKYYPSKEPYGGGKSGGGGAGSSF